MLPLLAWSLTIVPLKIKEIFEKKFVSLWLCTRIVLLICTKSSSGAFLLWEDDLASSSGLVSSLSSSTVTSSRFTWSATAVAVYEAVHVAAVAVWLIVNGVGVVCQILVHMGSLMWLGAQIYSFCRLLPQRNCTILFYQLFFLWWYWRDSVSQLGCFFPPNPGLAIFKEHHEQGFFLCDSQNPPISLFLNSPPIVGM